MLDLLGDSSAAEKKINADKLTWLHFFRRSSWNYLFSLLSKLLVFLLLGSPYFFSKVLFSSISKTLNVS